MTATTSPTTSVPMSALPPTDTTDGNDILEGEDITDPDFGNDLDGHISYHLRIRVGDKVKTLGFTLASGGSGNTTSGFTPLN